MGINSDKQLVLQVLEVPEDLGANDLAFLCQLRDVPNRDFGPPVEVIMRSAVCPTVDHLSQACIEALSLEVDIKDVTLAVYKPHRFEWEVVKDKRPRDEKGGLLSAEPGDPRSSKGLFNVRKPPVLLKDGEIIAMRNEQDNIDHRDDFQSDKNKEAKEAFIKAKQQKKQAGKRKRPVGPEKGISILNS